MNLDMIRARIADQGLDGIIANSYENVAYLSGAAIMTIRQIPERLAAVVLPKDGDPTLVVCTIEEKQARLDSDLKDIRGYEEFITSPSEAIAEVVREKGLAEGVLGVEERVLSLHYFKELQAHLPDVRFEPVDALLDHIRMVKTPQETTLLQKAALATDAAIRAAYEKGRVGMEDKLIANALANGIQSSGADSIAFLVLGAGPSAALGHPIPSSRPLEKGDIVRCDVGGFYSGYYSDMARTAVVGQPSAEQRDIYQRLWEIHEVTIDAARPGVRAKDLYETCRKQFEKVGLQLNLSHIGHSLGLGLHEHPILNPFNETVLEEGTLLAIEPVHKLDGGPIFHVEDLVEVCPNGGRVLSRSGDWSELFVIDG